MAKRESSPNEALRRANRALKTLSDCNLALSRARDETELLHAICRIAVVAGGYRLAWVGYAEQDDERRVRPVAQAGLQEGSLVSFDITWSDSERGRGPTGTAIRAGRTTLATDLQPDLCDVQWLSGAILGGYVSCVALPLVMQGETFGVLTIYAGEPDAFDEEEVALLTEVAVNLAHGIGTLRARARLSHGLRTPLGLIKILSATLLREDVDFDRETQRELLAGIQDEAAKLEGIVDNLLDLSCMKGQL